MPRCRSLRWPAATGRELLRSVPLERATLRPARARAGVEDTPQVFLFGAGTWSLKTSSERWFAGSDQARDALLALVRSKISLGPLLVSDTVLTLQTDPQGGYWLWTVTPDLTTLEAALHDRTEQTSRLETTLMAYADAALTTLRYAVRREVLHALHPGDFALIRGSTYYVGDDIRHGNWPPEFGARLLEPVDEFRDYADFVDAVLACKRTSEFGTLSEELADSLPYTCGAVYTSALLALEHGVSASTDALIQRHGLGRQIDPDGTHPKMVSLHMNTFAAAIEVFVPASTVSAAPA